MAQYPKHAAGERVYPNMTGYKMACCDCGLVHKINFAVFRKPQDLYMPEAELEIMPIADFGVRMQVWRDERATGQKRRKAAAPANDNEGEKA